MWVFAERVTYTKQFILELRSSVYCCSSFFSCTAAILGHIFNKAHMEPIVAETEQ